jgi:branched-chain amino acid transport system substrate-binding protein
VANRARRTARAGTSTSRRSPRLLVVGLFTVSTLVVSSVTSACTDEPVAQSVRSSDPVDSSSTGTPTATAASQLADDVLTLAVLVPDSGRGVQLGAALDAGARLAAAEINETGGIGGRPLRLVQRPESDDAGEMTSVIRELADDGVDGFIGPASNLVALEALGTIIDSGLLACSPTATALALDDFPDDERFIRTAPSDSLQAVAIAELVEASGAQTVVVAHLDDDFGQPMAAATADALRDQGVTVAAMIPFAANETSTESSALAVVAVEPDAVVVIADADSGPLAISAIDSRNSNMNYFVNDAQRRPEQLAAHLEGRVIGVSPMATTDDVAFTAALTRLLPESPAWFAKNAYDCVNLLALAALAGGSVKPDDVAGQIRAVATSGSRCTNFASCSTLLASDRNVDYDGPGGALDIGADGDPVRARFEVFDTDPTGIDRTIRVIVVGQ